MVQPGGRCGDGPTAGGGAVRRAARIDANQPDIVAALEKVGCQVLHLHQVGGGCPDLLVKTRGGRLLLLEIKDGAKPAGKRQLNLEQKRFHEDWFPCCRVIETVDDALKAVAL